MRLATRALAFLWFGVVLAPPLPAQSSPEAFWNSSTVYFLLIDRFRNGNPANDRALGRARDAALLRGFEGGDLAGVLRKIEDGYFDSLGVTAIWMTPFVEQIHGSVDEGTGKTYGYHGYWTRDWTAVDPALGTKDDLRAVVNAAHRHGIRVLMDAVINHTGPPTRQDPAWPADWVRAGPQCAYRDFASTVNCNLVAHLPDIRTDRDAPVRCPMHYLPSGAERGDEIGKSRGSMLSSGAPDTPARRATTSSSGSPIGCASSGSTATGWIPPSISSRR